MLPGHPLAASAADRPSRWVPQTTGSDVAAELLATDRYQMPCTEESHSLFFFVLYLISGNSEKLVISENVQETLRQQAVTTN